MVVTAIILLLCIVGFGVLFLRLHTLPERLAHKSQKIQFEIVAVLGLLALFTHIHAFWVAGLLLALIDFPDFGSFLGRIAGSVEKIAAVRQPSAEANDAQPAEIVERVSHSSGTAWEAHDHGAKGDTTSATRPERMKEASHA
jgi:hypothetical protein